MKLQVDVGFGDAITPAPELAEFPPLLDFTAPKMRVYPRATVVAEKLEAMVKLGLLNSRMKDFYDVVILSRSFSFDGDELARAIRATFERRGTELPKVVPVALTDEFATDAAKQTQWAGFVRKADAADDVGDPQHQGLRGLLDHTRGSVDCLNIPWSASSRGLFAGLATVPLARQRGRSLPRTEVATSQERLPRISARPRASIDGAHA